MLCLYDSDDVKNNYLWWLLTNAMLFGILEDPHLGRAKNQSVIVLQLNLRLISHTGWFRTTVFYNFFLANIIFLRNSKTQSYFESICMDILIFWYLNMVKWKNHAFQSHAFTLQLLHFSSFPLGLSFETHLWTYLSTSDMPKYHPDTPQTPLHTPLHIPDTNRHQQTPTDITQTPLNTPRHDSGVSDSVCQCLVMSAAVCWCLRPLGGVRGVSRFV